MTHYQTNSHVVVTERDWSHIVKHWPHSEGPKQPYATNDLSVFGGRSVIVLKTIGM